MIFNKSLNSVETYKTRGTAASFAMFEKSGLQAGI